jgi:hypothetical protein
MREKVWHNPDPEQERAAENLFQNLLQHFVAMLFRFERLDENGRSDGKIHFKAFSCVPMTIKGEWFLVTAGHILRELDDATRNKLIKITSCNFVDYFARAAVVEKPTPFDFTGAFKTYLYDDSRGLDFGLIRLPDLIRWGFEANKIVPFPCEQWIHPDRLDFENYWMLGLPYELIDSFNQPVDGRRKFEAKIAPVILSVQRVTNPAEIPPTVQIPVTKHPIFIGKITAPDPPDIEGMSGGPVFGVRPTAGGGIEYWIVALQSGWFKSSLITTGCFVAVFANIVLEAMKRLNNQPDGGA